LPGQYVPFAPSYYNLYRAGSIAGRDKYRSCSDHGYEAETDFGLDLLLGQRKEIVNAQMGLLNFEIEERRRIKERNLYRIDLDQCYCRNTIMLRGEDLWDRDRLKLEQSIRDLEREKRQSYENYFRDLLFLKREMRQVLIEGLEEDQKAAMLTNYPGVNP